MAAEDAAKPSTLPPYPEMILAAIDALNDKNGSSKSAISRHIEDTHGDQPPAHASLLTAHLARMKESGELIFVKNNYFRSDAPDAPPKRGRGRPPKPRDPNAPPKPSSPRPRGRPPKAKGALDAAVAQATTGTPRARGRPPKAKGAHDAAVAQATTVTPRVRGRPPKAKGVLDAAVAQATAGSPRARGRPPKAKRAQDDPGTPSPRGRPPKKAKTDAPAPSHAGDGSTTVKRSRGRPPKVRPAVPSETAAA